MKTSKKTAIIVCYPVYGTRHSSYCTVMYKGKVLWQLTTNDYPLTLIKQATNWAIDHKFTNFTITNIAS